MAKIVLPPVASIYNVSTINNNFQEIADELSDDVLYRRNPSGQPNQMFNPLDMNSQRILNLPEAVSDLEPVRKGDVGPLLSLSAAAVAAAATATTKAAEASTSATTASTAASTATAAATSASNSNTAAGVSAAAALASELSAADSAALADSNSRLTIGTVTTGAPGSSAEASITGPTGTQVLSFVIPSGETGPQGIQGVAGPQGPVGPVGPEGPKGDQGQSFTVDATGDFVNRSTYDSEPEGFSFLAVDQGLLYFRVGVSGWGTGIPFGKGDKGDTGDTGPEGPEGPQGIPGVGINGWTPTLAAIVSGLRVVHQVTDWVGGTGTKPATGSYVGATGLVVDIADAIDVRGPAGFGDNPPVEVKAANFTAENGGMYACNTSGGTFIATLPATPLAGWSCTFFDYAGTFDTDNLTVARNGSNILGVADNYALDQKNYGRTFTYSDTTKGWLIK